MKNIGFISKKKIAVEIARIYRDISDEADSANATKEDRLSGWAAQSKLNLLCLSLKIKPAHTVRLGKRN